MHSDDTIDPLRRAYSRLTGMLGAMNTRTFVMPAMFRSAQRLLLGLSLALLAVQATDGPPFRTDDPMPVPYGDYEAYLFSAGTQGGGG